MSRAPAHVLVADPDRLQLQLIDMLLSGDGFELTLVDSGRDALEHLKETSPDLCLLALDLPDVSGDDICGKVRRVSRLAKTPVVLIAPQEGRFGLSDDARRRARRAGADLVLPRPLGDKNLRERLQAVLAEGDATPEREGYSTAVIEEALEEIDEAGPPPHLGRPSASHEAAPTADDPADEAVVLDPTPSEATNPEAADPAPAQAAEEAGSDAVASDAGASTEAPPVPPAEDAEEPADAPAEKAESDAETARASHARHGPHAEMSPTTMPGAESTTESKDLARLRKEREILRVENAQLKRKLKEKQEQLERGVNFELERKIEELERRNAALLKELEKREEDEERGGLFGRRR